MRKARHIPKPRKIRKPVAKPTEKTLIDETPKLGQIESDFEAEYQAFIQELRSRKGNNETTSETEAPQDIQPD